LSLKIDKRMRNRKKKYEKIENQFQTVKKWIKSKKFIIIASNKPARNRRKLINHLLCVFAKRFPSKTLE